MRIHDETAGGAATPSDAEPAREPDTELELKFVVPPQDVAKLRTAAWVRPLQQGRTTTRSLNAIYFDTPDRAIWKRGMSFRVRKEGRRFVQTVKSRGTQRDRAFARDEWQTPVRQAAPDLTAILGDSELARQLPAQPGDRLEPVFETDIRRTKRLLHTPEGSDVEWALDIGEIRTDDGVTPVCELELELLNGPTAGLFTVARDLIAHVPARLVTRSKADRGYALAGGAGASWHKAAPIHLEPDATAETTLARSITQCLDHLASNEDCVLARDHVEGVHQMRVALRRLRSALNIYKTLLPADDFARLDGEAKRCIDVLGPARDWDVFLTETLSPVAAWISEEPALSEFRALAERVRDRAYEHAQDMIRSLEYAALLLDIGAWTNSRGWRDQPVSEASARLFGPAIDLGRETLGRRHRKLLKAGRHLKTMSVADRHRLRIAVKKQRYATEFFSRLFAAKPAKAYVARLSALQDHLGLLNDIATAERLTRGIVDAAAADRKEAMAYASGLIVGWQQQELKGHETALFGDWKRLKETKPFW